VVVNGWKGKAEKVVKATGWNEYEVLCKGGHIELRVNGLPTAEYDDPTKKPDGLLGFQVHKGPGMLVEWRNVRIKELK
jgi:hypothetical protein